jgi:hypothetical protein
MFRLEFGIEHRGCVVNELSRAVPHVRLICPGGFILDDRSADEVLVLDKPEESDVDAVLDFLGRSDGIKEAKLLERTVDKAFVRILTTVAPDAGYCSEAVEGNHGFRLGYEIQQGGVERWDVGLLGRSQAEALVERLKGMGELKYHRVSEVSWAGLA